MYLVFTFGLYSLRFHYPLRKPRSWSGHPIDATSIILIWDPRLSQGLGEPESKRTAFHSAILHLRVLEYTAKYDSLMWFRNPNTSTCPTSLPLIWAIKNSTIPNRFPYYGLVHTPQPDPARFAIPYFNPSTHLSFPEVPTWKNFHL